MGTMFTAIVLSAGLSSRFGSAKALAQVDHHLIIEHLQEILITSKVTKINIVLGADAKKIKPYILKHKKVKVVYNKDYNLGQTSSFKSGLKMVDVDSSGVLLLPVDFPFIATTTIDFLINQMESVSSDIHACVPIYHGIKGHPPVFRRTLFEDFQNLDNSKGINEILHRRQDQIKFIPIEDKGIISTFNTREEFEAIKLSFKI
jgi:molybdenum cofactor cytidylyltransferase